MDIISLDTIVNLIESQEGLGVSIYMPIHVTAREARQNPIRLKNLISKVEDQLSLAGMNESDIASYLSPLTALVDDEIFWQDQSEGCALFLDQNELRIYRLPEDFEPLAFVGESFHITPLIPIYEGNGQFLLLAIDQKRPKIYQGSKFSLLRVEELDLPVSLREMLDNFYEINRHIQFHNKTINPNPDLNQNRKGMYFGHGGGEMDEKAEIQNYFHKLDEALMTFLADHDAPMVLAGIEFLHPLYKEANSYPNLMQKGIEKNVEQISEEELHQLAWDIVKEKYEQDVHKAIDVYHRLKSANGDTSTEIEEIVAASHFKRVHTLFIAEGTSIWGSFNPQTQGVEIEEHATYDNEDLINFSAANTLMNGGNVFVLQQKNVPEKSKVTAIFRY